MSTHHYGLLAILGMSLCACGKSSDENVASSTVVVDKAAPDGWTTIQSSDKKYSISLPPEWKPLHFDKATFQKRLESSASKDNRIAGFKRATESATSHDEFKLMFSHPGAPGAYSANGSVLSVPGHESLEAVVAGNVKHLQGHGVVINRAHSNLPGNWEELTYETESKAHHTMVDHWCFIEVENGRAVFLSFAIPADDKSDQTAVESIAKTIKVSD